MIDEIEGVSLRLVHVLARFHWLFPYLSEVLTGGFYNHRLRTLRCLVVGSRRGKRKVTAS